MRARSRAIIATGVVTIATLAGAALNHRAGLLRTPA
jgi:hypothetical protein